MLVVGAAFPGFPMRLVGLKLKQAAKGGREPVLASIVSVQQSCDTVNIMMSLMSPKSVVLKSKSCILCMQSSFHQKKLH